MDHDEEGDYGKSWPRIRSPELPPVTPQGIARRRELFDEVVERRERMGLTGIPTDQLLRPTPVDDGAGFEASRRSEVDRDDDECGVATLPRINLPEFPPVTAEEIERRRQVAVRILERRERIGPIGIPVEDLIHEIRGGDDRFDKDPPELRP